jgi:hypothetical protein
MFAAQETDFSDDGTAGAPAAQDKLPPAGARRSAPRGFPSRTSRDGAWRCILPKLIVVPAIIATETWGRVYGFREVVTYGQKRELVHKMGSLPQALKISRAFDQTARGPRSTLCYKCGRPNHYSGNF